MWDACEVDLAVCREDTGGGAVKRIVKAVREDLGFVQLTISVFVDKHTNLIRVFGVVGKRFDSLVLSIHCEPLRSGSERNIVAEPMLIATVVLDAAIEAMGFRKVEPIFFVKGDGGDVESIWFTCIDASCHFFWVLDSGEKCFVWIRGREFFWIGCAFNFGSLFIIGAGK